jgi:hypothetical protein
VKSESAVQSEIRLAAHDAGVRLWRNNVGVARDPKGRAVRFGLANESKNVNERIKSGDLIGWREVVITPDMVGKTLAQFVSIECKREGYRPGKTKREIAQRRWAQLIVDAGGLALIVSNVVEFVEAAKLGDRKYSECPDNKAADNS